MYAGLTQWNATVPFTWKNTDRVFIDISIPIAQWGVNVNLASDFTEYASNDGSGGVAAGTTYNTGSVYGPDGSNIPSVNSSTSGQITQYRATFQRPIQPSDKIFIEIKTSGSTVWKDASHGNPLVTQGGFLYGCWWDYDTTDPSGKSVRVLFGNGGGVPGSSYNVAGTAWSAYTANKYRVRKVSNGNMAEQPPVVRAEYQNQAAVAGNSRFIMSNKIEDTHSAYNPATGAFSVPVAGVYLIEYVADSLLTGGTQSVVVVNETDGKNKTFQITASGRKPYVLSLRAKAGDVLSLKTGTSVTAPSDTFALITFERLGS
jgi:hypothetical protein